MGYPYISKKRNYRSQGMLYMTELGGTLHPLARNTPASFSLTKGLPVPKLMGITSPAICSSFSLRCRDTPLASKKSKPTAAQVTLVSEEFYKSLDPAPPIRKEVVMNTAGKGMQMNGYIAGPFQVVLGTHLFTVEIYVAPIEEDMLLGLDFLEANGVPLHLKEKELQIAGEVIPMSLGTGSPLVNEKETGVFLVKGCKVPPNSVILYSNRLNLRTHLFCIGQYFPLFQFYIMIG
jgi:hypothetical protein